MYLLQLLISALLGGGIGYRFGFSLQSLFLILLLFVGNVISFTDIQCRIIPNDMIITIFGIKLVFGILALMKVGNLPKWNPLLSLAGFAVLAAIFFLPVIFGKKIGFGDIKLAMAMGFAAELMPGLYAICLMGGLVILYGFLQREVPFVGFLKMNFPMGPFLCTALIVALLIP
ncbi:MAG: prepilin peptidase [Mogibacterium sp.]|nr:prepilin peptidase [Mogibacterium sp.]